ncbi:MAG: glycine cleavage system aminomethyltransferase GcvT [Thermoplasmata archaeon]|nr:glycine cleavage system aminomethyltransferase GcvT [Thermoplasmata archaeon]
MEPKKTPLYAWHVKNGAKMVEFAGYLMPVQYKSIIQEHRAVRESVGLFDVSHMGDFIIYGRDAGNFLNKLCTNNFATCEIGKCRYTHILNEEGKILDDMIGARIGEFSYLFVPNAATIEKMYRWFTQHRIGDVEIINASDALGCIALQGKNAPKVLAKLTNYPLEKLSFFKADFVSMDRAKVHERQEKPAFEWTKIADLEKTHGQKIRDFAHGTLCFVSRTGYTGEDGFEIISHAGITAAIWEALLDAGREFGIIPVGLGARDTLRLEKGFLLSGTDFHDDRTTIEANAEFAVKYDHDFIGRKALEQQKANGNYERLVGILVSEGVPRHGHEIYAGGRRIGIVTSGTVSPVLNRGIALGYLPKDFAVEGTEVQIKIRDKFYPGKVVKMPFV